MKLYSGLNCSCFFYTLPIKLGHSISSVCFSELLKKQKTKSRKKIKEGAILSFVSTLILLRFLLFFSWPGKWVDRVTLPLHCHFILSPSRFLFIPPCSLFFYAFFCLLFFHSEWFLCAHGEPSFHCPTLFSLCETLTPAWETVADNRREEPVYEMKKKIKRGRIQEEVGERKGYLGRVEKGEKKKRCSGVWLGPVRHAVTE